MAEAERATTRTASQPSTLPDHAALPCGTCANLVDPLRAARVAIFSERFCYFCSAECRERFVPGLILGARKSLPPPPPREKANHASSALKAAASPSRVASTQGRVPLLPTTAGLGAAVMIMSLLGGVLPEWVLTSGVALATACLMADAKLQLRFKARSRVAFEAAAPLAAFGATLVSQWVRPSLVATAAITAGAILLTSALSQLLAKRRELSLEPERQRVERALSHDARSGAEALRPGEEIVLEAGSRATVDAVVIAGQAQVEPWCDANQRALRKEGDSIWAGATVIDGAVRAVVRWVGTDRAWARLTIDPARRADQHVAAAKLASDIARGGACIAGVAGVLVALFTRVHPLLAVSWAAASYASLANVALRDRVAWIVARGLYRALNHGAVFRSPAALDRAGRVSLAIFCARGTLLCGEYSVASIEPTKGLRTEELLALAAGAYGAAASPIGRALQLSAHAHQVRPDATRSHNYQPGLGVTAVSSSGPALVVGSRALLLECRISVASAETRITELEALGREVLLVALDGNWVGLIALQDRPEPGARGAVQQLLDVGVEPVWLSGDARETSRALARHMGIDHVRPEVLPDDRANEIRRLSQAEAAVAVIGRSSLDDPALAAAPLSIDLDPSGGPLERWDIEIASGDVRSAASTLGVARSIYAESRLALIATLAPAFVALLVMLLGAPAWIAPLVSLTGGWIVGRRPAVT